MTDKPHSFTAQIQTRITHTDKKALLRLAESLHMATSTLTRSILEDRLNFERHAGNPVMQEDEYVELFPRTAEPAQPAAPLTAPEQGNTPGNQDAPQAPTENK